MKYFTIIIVFLFSQIQHSQTVSCRYLQDPNLMIGYVDSCAKFWMSAYDSTRGGFYTNVSRTGTVITSWGTQKNTMTQSRDAYGLVRAFQMTGNEWYLKRAKDALTFMYQHGWDNTNGGWHWELDINGNPTSNNGTKTAFYQHYALLGPAACFEATRDSLHWTWLKKGYDNNEAKLWDNRPNYFGYYDEAQSNWTNIKNKSFNATVDAITTHTLLMYLLTGQQQFKSKLDLIADNMLNRLSASIPTQAIGFVEKYNSDWAYDNSNLTTIMGHVLKTGWCFARMHELFPNPIYLDAAKALTDHVLLKGYDHQYGGPYKDYNRSTGQMLMWGNPDTAKAWWQMEQAVTGGLLIYDLTSDVKYLQMADETLLFFMTYFVDHQYGEVYENRARSGPLTWGDHKGNGNKAAYHSIELGYYTYLYGSLLYLHNPVSLYYSIASSTVERRIKLNPIEIADSRYRIKDVKLNGAPFANFIASTRELIIPALTGGKFKVTFEMAPTAVADRSDRPYPIDFELSQNYPNPFNPTTTIKYQIPRNGLVSLIVYDALGREVQALVNEEKTQGKYSVEFNASNLPSGVYFYTMRSGDFVSTKKMILVK